MTSESENTTDILYIVDRSEESIEYVNSIQRHLDNKYRDRRREETTQEEIKPKIYTPEEVFIEFDNLNITELYNYHIVTNLLNKLQTFLINHIPLRFRRIELLRWKEIFISLGYNENDDTYIFNWINDNIQYNSI